tara:strand:+ start:355 stop:726 length:372 start_codon:yes stop_codon:yes gene_type:complete
MTYKLDTTSAHDKDIVDRFNKIAKRYTDDSILEHILVNWVDDSDLLDIAETLENRFIENQESKSLSHNDTRDIAIRCAQRLVELGHLKDNYDTYLDVEDTIQDEINDKLGLDIDDRFEITIKY